MYMYVVLVFACTGGDFFSSLMRFTCAKIDLLPHVLNGVLQTFLPIMHKHLALREAAKNIIKNKMVSNL